MGTGYEDSFGWTDYAAGFAGEPAFPQVAFGAGVFLEFTDIEPLILGTRVTIPFKAGSRQFVGPVSETNAAFSMVGIGALFMGNLIQKAAQSAINVTELSMAAEDGLSSCDVVAPTGSQWRAKGMGLDIQNHTSNFAVAQEASFSMHTNTGSAVINGTLPTNPRQGTVVGMMRTGAQLNVALGDVTKRIFNHGSGFFRPAGQSAFLASSGAQAFFISDVNQDWYPWFPAGTIN
jgi:hypothetical protein